MSKNMEKKLLAECFDAIVNDNDIARATRLFKRHWDLSSKNAYALLESADEDFEISDMGDDFNNEIADEIGSDAEEKFNQIQIAIDELEDKFPAEVTDEVRSKFDDLRNIVDEMKLADEGEDDGLAEDAAVALEDLRGEFDMNGEMNEEITDLFDEISAGLQGDVEADEEVDVADDADMADEGEDIEECGNAEVIDEGEEADSDVDLEFEEPSEEAEDEVEADEGEEEGDYEEVQRDEDKVIDDIKYSADELVALIDELEGIEGDEKEAVDESWSKISDPRKSMTSEKEGVDKKGTMNFGKLRGLTLDKKAGLGTSEVNSKGISADKKAKVQSVENKGAKSWTKVAKPANKPASDKSMMGK